MHGAWDWNRVELIGFFGDEKKMFSTFLALSYGKSPFHPLRPPSISPINPLKRGKPMAICPNLSDDLNSYGISCADRGICAGFHRPGGGGVAMRCVGRVLSLCLWGTHTHSPSKNAPFPLHQSPQRPTFQWQSLKNTGVYTPTANYFFYKEFKLQIPAQIDTIF